MDPRISTTQYSSYVEFLQSQSQNVVSENFPYESFPHSSVHTGASEIPPFSSQQSEAPSPAEDTPTERQERKKWTPADDEVLISAWLNTSKDVVVRIDQKSGTFWKRVGEYYAESPHVLVGGDKTKHNHCKQRWHKINDWTNKFCGAFAAAERQMTSGQNETDVLKLAHDIYYANHKQKFSVEHAWCVLRYEQKWISLNPSKTHTSSKRKTSESVTRLQQQWDWITAIRSCLLRRTTV
ncbi:glutathione S-transferase T2-like [Brassica napus]|uniref:glutathione S-transferase T2-like n=1 Tax=Brassica napus TaxID=3708 RepID=UPI002078DDD3|nr:glutathione S-transferase T2-like [Brassica napus]